MTDARNARTSTEVLVQWIGSARNTRSSVEVLIQTSDRAKITNTSFEYLISKITSTSIVDDFDRINSTNYVGGLWRVITGTWGITNNKLYNSGDTSGLIVIETTETDGELSLAYEAVGTQALAFWVTDANNYYRFELNTGNLVKKSAGTDTILDSTTPLSANGYVSVVMEEDTITVKQSSNELISYTDPSPTKATQQGIASSTNTGKGKHVGWKNKQALDALAEGWGQLPLI